MPHPDVDKAFTGSIPEIYDRYLVPLIFEAYASDLANRLAARPLGSVLEIACGTGAVTRRLASTLPPSISITATDLNPPMLDYAAGVGTERPVVWRQADAMQLPFEDGEFDAVVCQFGAMFFPDRPKAYAEARRVLKPGGIFLFSVWDRIDRNEFADTITQALGALFPDDPPRFLPRTPYAYCDPAIIEQDIRLGGFSGTPGIETVTERSRAASPRHPAIGFCKGSPLRGEIETRGGPSLDEATEAAAEAIRRRFGPESVQGGIQAHVITVEARSSDGA
jgi:SAM-dependent methyltransferase